MRNNCLHKSLWNIEYCLLLTVSIPALFVFGYVWIVIGLFKCAWSNPFVFSGLICLAVLIWVLFLQRHYYYDDEIVILFPLRPFKRKTIIRYEDIDHIDYKSSRCYEALEYILVHSTRSHQRYVKNVCYGWLGFFVPMHSKKLMFLLKFLKQKGCPIQRPYDGLYSRRIVAAFGPDDNVERVPRAEILSSKKNECKAQVVSVIVLLLIVAAVLIFYFFILPLFPD